MATATDFQSLLSSPNAACYLNLSPGEWMGVKLALLQDIARSLGVGVTTLNTSGLIYGPPGLGILHYVAVPVTSGGTYVVTPGVNENGIYLDLTGDGLAAQTATGTLLANGVSITVTAVGSYLYFEGGHVGATFTGVITQDPFTPSNLLITQNVACYANLPPGMQEGIKLALLQDIVLNIPPGGGGSPWTPNVPIPGATLIEWVKGDTLTGSSGSQISDWPASAGQDLIQTPDSGANPTILTGTYFHPAARFNGTSDTMSGSGFVGPSQPVTMALVFSYKGSLSVTSTIIDFGSAAGPPNFGTSAGQFVVNAGTSVNLLATDAALHILFVTFNGASSKYAFDGAALSSISVGSDALNNLIVGALADISHFSQVDLGEILVWTGDVSGSYSEIFTYLSNRWLTA